MYEEKKKKLRKFVKPHHEEYIGGIWFIVIGITGVVFGIMEHDYQTTFLSLLFAILLGGGILYSGISATLKYRKKIQHIEDSSALEILMDDFENGSRAFKDSLILGKVFLIGKRMGTIVSYNEIVRIYQYIEKTNGVESKRTIKIETADNRKLDLCKLKRWGKSDDEFVRLLNI